MDEEQCRKVAERISRQEVMSQGHGELLGNLVRRMDRTEERTRDLGGRVSVLQAETSGLRAIAEQLLVQLQSNTNSIGHVRAGVSALEERIAASIEQAGNHISLRIAQHEHHEAKERAAQSSRNNWALATIIFGMVSVLAGAFYFIMERF